MTDRLIQIIQSGLLAFVVGIFGALLLAHYAACQEDDSFCAFTGSDQPAKESKK